MRQLLKKKKRHAASACALRRWESGQKRCLGSLLVEDKEEERSCPGIRALRGSVG